MAYKRIDGLLKDLNYLSKPGLEDCVRTFFTVLENRMKHMAVNIYGEYLTSVIIGYQHGYTSLAVAESIVKEVVNKTINYSLNGELINDDTINTIIKDISGEDGGFDLTPGDTHPFFSHCDYKPSSEEFARDPLDVIDEINARRKEREFKLDGKDVGYPRFGSWTDQSIRISGANESKGIREFRGDVQKEIITIARNWFE